MQDMSSWDCPIWTFGAGRAGETLSALFTAPQLIALPGQALPAWLRPTAFYRRNIEVQSESKAASVGGLSDLPRPAAFGTGLEIVLLAQANRPHISILTCRVTFGTIALDFLLVGHGGADRPCLVIPARPPVGAAGTATIGTISARAASRPRSGRTWCTRSATGRGRPDKTRGHTDATSPTHTHSVASYRAKSGIFKPTGPLPAG